MTDAFLKGKQSLFLMHRKPLAKQTYRTLTRFDAPASIIGVPQFQDLSAPIQILSAQALGTREIPPHHLLVVDEAHTITFYRLVKQLIETTSAFVIGMTATPYRTKRTESLADYYEALVKAPEPRELIQMGALVPFRYFSYDTIDFSRVPINRYTDDFDEAELEAVSNTPKMLDLMITEYKRLALGRRTIVFAAGIKHSLAITKKFLDEGIPCAHVDGSMPDRQRETLYDQLKEGELSVVSSVDALTEGFDCAPVSCCIHFRATISRPKKEQMEGRASRTVTMETEPEFLMRHPEFSKRDAIFIDLVGNVKRHGRMDAPQNITLRPASDSPPGVAPVKVCDNCQAAILAWHRYCPECQCEFELEPSDIPDAQLSELLEDWERIEVEFLHAQARIAYQRSYKPGFATMRFKEQFGYYPAAWWRRCAVFGAGASEAQKLKYHSYLTELAQKHGYDADWIEHWMIREFGSQFLSSIYD